MVTNLEELKRFLEGKGIKLKVLRTDEFLSIDEITFKYFDGNRFLSIRGMGSNKLQVLKKESTAINKEEAETNKEKKILLKVKSLLESEVQDGEPTLRHYNELVESRKLMSNLVEKCESIRELYHQNCVTAVPGRVRIEYLGVYISVDTERRIFIKSDGNINLSESLEDITTMVENIKNA